MEIPPDLRDGDFTKALLGEDALGVVIRAHIHIEAKLIELLEVLLEPKTLERMKLDYSQRIQLAVALGLKEEHAPPLQALGSIRNAFAHRLDAALDANRVNNLYNSLSAQDKEAVQQAYIRTNSQMQRDGVAFANLDPKDKFVLIAVSLRAMLRVAVAELKTRAKR